MLLSRFFMSLLACDSSSTLACSSWLTVCSSSFRDCISSLEVVSSSLVLWSSSLVDCNSSLVDLSSSWEVCISSRSGLQLLAGRLEFLLQLGQPGAADSGPFGSARRFRFGGRRHVRKDDHHHPPQRLRLFERLDGDIHGLRPAVGPHLHAPQGDRAFLPERLLECGGQLEAQPLAGHGEDVPVGLAGRRLQVLARPPADVEDVALVVDQHGRRGIVLQEQLIRQRLEVGRGFERHGLLRRARQDVGKGGGKLDRLCQQGGIEAPVEPRFAVQRGEEVGRSADGLRAPQKQDAAGIQAVVKERQELLLQLRVQVDQQVPAGQDVELGEGRVHDEVLRGKDHHLADLFADPVAVLVLDKEPAQALRRHIRGDVGRIDALAGFVDGVPVQVGGKDLERKVPGRLHLLQRLFEDDGQGIGFLPRRAAGHPGPQRLAGRAARQERRDDLSLQLLPGRRVAEKAGHADQKLLEEQLQFLGILLQKPDVGGDLVNLVDAHAPLDPAVDGALLVQGKVVARLRPAAG